jgi:HAMP domain-containing protein
VPELVTNGADEVSHLSQSFNRMRRSLQKALSLIEKG